jgi:hypothetical protein
MKLRIEGDPEEVAHIHDRLPVFVERLAKALDPHDPAAAAALRDMAEGKEHDAPRRPRMPALAASFDAIHRAYERQMGRMVSEIVAEVAKAITSGTAKKSYASLIYEDAIDEFTNLRQRLQRFGYGDDDFDRTDGVLFGVDLPVLQRYAEQLEAGEDPAAAFVTTKEEPCS